MVSLAGCISSGNLSPGETCLPAPGKSNTPKEEEGIGEKCRQDEGVRDTVGRGGGGGMGGRNCCLKV